MILLIFFVSWSIWEGILEDLGKSGKNLGGFGKVSGGLLEDFGSGFGRVFGFIWEGLGMILFWEDFGPS